MYRLLLYKTTTCVPIRTKFQAIVLGMKNPETLHFQLGNITIMPEYKVKLLGIDLDSKLNFNCHIHEICQKAARQFNLMMISIDNLEHHFVQGNSILRKLNMCSVGVKLTIFRTCCSPMYTAQLWWNYKNLPLINYKNLPLLNYKLLIVTFKKCFLACPNMKAPATYAHFLTCNASNL